MHGKSFTRNQRTLSNDALTGTRKLFSFVQIIAEGFLFVMSTLFLLAAAPFVIISHLLVVIANFLMSSSINLND